MSNLCFHKPNQTVAGSAIKLSWNKKQTILFRRWQNFYYKIIIVWYCVVVVNPYQTKQTNTMLVAFVCHESFFWKTLI